MKLKSILLLITTVAVVSDAMLIPFYPQFFADRYGVHDARQVGAYLAAICLTVMLALPLWARVSRRVPLLTLLVYTQLGAGVLCLACGWMPSLPGFWLLSLGMFVFKGSYLLIYPRVMGLSEKDEHAATIGLLSVIMHFGGIVGAVLGGVVLQMFNAAHVFLAMAAGDAIQIAICLFLLRCRLPLVRQMEASLAAPVVAEAETGDRMTDDGAGDGARRRRVYALGALMLLFYFSACLVRPFFAQRWERVSGMADSRLAAAVFALPAMMALAGLWHNRRRARHGLPPLGSLPQMLLVGTLGLLMQALPGAAALLAGRCLFGWSMFQLAVQLDVRLFHLGTPRSYASDFSTINLFQSSGVLASSFAAGGLVAGYGLASPFLVAAAGFALTALAYPVLIAAPSRLATV